jgi:hypothetical protein
MGSFPWVRGDAALAWSGSSGDLLQHRLWDAHAAGEEVVHEAGRTPRNFREQDEVCSSTTFQSLKLFNYSLLFLEGRPRRPAVESEKAAGPIQHRRRSPNRESGDYS